MKEKNLSRLYQSPTAFNATKNIKDILLASGYKQIDYSEKLVKGGKYFSCKNDSSIIAINIGKKVSEEGFSIVASHLDCPSFKLKPEPIVHSDGYTKLNVEGYGGMIMSTWLDRPLSLAGRVIVKKEGRICTEIVNIDENLLLIPNVAIHMNREINNGYKFNVKDDLIPVLNLNKDINFNQFIKDKCKLEGDVLTYDLYLYPRIKPFTWGDDNEFLSSFHLDNLGCALTSLNSFLSVDNEEKINVYVSFDNEEVGSLTQQGADSTFLADYLKKITNDLNFDYLKMIDNSLLVSADNAHAHHPNHPEYSDRNNKAYINEGIVVKYNANQAYTSDSISLGLFQEILKLSNVPFQFFSNRADIRGGSTLGNISNAHVSLKSIDIGLPQLAMHSSLETCGTKDWDYMEKALKAFYEIKITKNNKGEYTLK